ncbi:MAG: tRNA dihydrouridine synthase DusB [Oscillospiraceae bacterium]|nr:tRNA dihydrouridine synthase DusB [Oscillospiraceae bacterium]
MKIGDVALPSRLILAPMAGVTDLAFRELCRGFGAGLTVTEMVSAKALVYGDGKTRALLESSGADRPFAAQIFGSDPDDTARGAALALEHSGADIIDINMGCPVGKIVKNGEGSALMLEPEKASRIIAAVVRAVNVPVTVKFRRGFDRAHLNAAEFAKMCEDSGASAVAVHGRTRVQMYSGAADWDCIAEVKRAVRIPVAANGDVFAAEDAVKILAHTCADGVMLARGVLGNPWLFRETAAALAGLPVPARPAVREIAETALRQITRSAELRGEKVACLEARRHYSWYLRGIPHAAYWRGLTSKIESLADARSVTRSIVSTAESESRDSR